MKTLVLGGNGSIGSHVVDELPDAGYKVSRFGLEHEVVRKPLSAVNYYLGEFSNTPLPPQVLQGLSLQYDWVDKKGENPASGYNEQAHRPRAGVILSNY